MSKEPTWKACWGCGQQASKRDHEGPDKKEDADGWGTAAGIRDGKRPRHEKSIDMRSRMKGRAMGRRGLDHTGGWAAESGPIP